MGETRKVVRVACSVPNGIALRLSQEFTEFGIKGMRLVGDPVILRGPTSPRSDFSPGEEITDVDAEFWAKWLAQNARNPLVVNKSLRDFDEKPKDETAKPEQGKSNKKGGAKAP